MEVGGCNNEGHRQGCKLLIIKSFGDSMSLEEEFGVIHCGGMATLDLVA